MKMGSLSNTLIGWTAQNSLGVISIKQCVLHVVVHYVKENDIIEITFGQRTLKVRVLDVKEFTKKNEAASLYEVLDQ
jgi:ribosomal 50S subunit-recycling heat shock protein